VVRGGQRIFACRETGSLKFRHMGGHSLLKGKIFLDPSEVSKYSGTTRL